MSGIVCRVSTKKPEGKRELESPRDRWKTIIKWNK